MLKVTNKTYYGLKAVIELALKNNGKTLRVNEIAKNQGISLRFLEIILNELKHEGLVKSKRGPEGGYMLALAPDEITLMKILDALEKPFVKKMPEMNNCFGDFALNQLWNNLEVCIMEFLTQVTIKDLVEVENKEAKKALNYFI